MTQTPSSEKITPLHNRVLHVWSSPLIERAVSFIAVSRAKPLAFRLALSALFVAAAFTARTTLFPNLSDYPSYIPFHAAVILAAVCGGAGGCLSAALLSIAAVHTFFVPINQPIALAQLIVFASTAVLLAVLTELLGLAQRGLLIAEQQHYRDTYWRLFIEQAPVAIAMFDRQMRCMAASSQWSDRHGRRRETASGLQKDETAPSLPPHLKDAHRRALAGETVRCEEEEITLADGTRLIERWEMVPWRETDGSIGGATVISEDISARVTAERELRESKENLKRAQSIARVANWRMNFASGQLKGSAQTFELLGQSPDAVLDYERLLAMVDDADRRLVGETRKSALRGEAYDIEYRYVVNGRTGWMREYSKPEYDTAGHLVGAFGVIQDVTDRKLIEMNLSSSEERLRLALEAAGMAVWDLDLRTGNDVWNDQSYRMIGYEPGEIAAGYATWLDHVHPDDRTAVDDAFKKSLADGTELQSEYRVIDRHGTLKWVSVRGRTKVDNTGQPVRSFGVITDVTERKQAEERDRILSAEVTHRAKNLLAVVQAVAIQTARNQKPNEFLAAFNERLKSLAVSHDLLVNANWQAVEIGALVRSQLAHFEDLFSKRIHFRGPGIGLTAEAAQAIGLALHELVTNASKYGALSTPGGTVTVDWSVDRSQTPARFRMLWKESGGPPVSEPDQRGFGHSVLVNMAAYALGADVALHYPSDGVSWTLEAPARLIMHAAASGAAA
ncbi:MAG: PAS domain S-box protein [Deltaproteobacteria bacterium]